MIKTHDRTARRHARSINVSSGDWEAFSLSRVTRGMKIITINMNEKNRTCHARRTILCCTDAMEPSDISRISATNRESLKRLSRGWVLFLQSSNVPPRLLPTNPFYIIPVPRLLLVSAI